MRRLSPKQRCRLMRQQQARERLDQRARRRKLRSRQLRRKNQPATTSDSTVKHSVTAPAIFRLTNPIDREGVLGFLEQLETECQRGGHVFVDFAETKRLFPCGTLLFMAHINRLIEQKQCHISCSYPVDNVVEQLFTHIGLFDRLNISRRVSPTHETVTHWHYLQGSCSDLTGLNGLMKTLEASLSLEVRSRLFASLSEAVANAIDHAYPGQEPESKHWWLFAKLQEDMVFIAVCDRGIGIPDSLRQKPLLRDYVERLKRLHKRRMDQFLIADAVGSPRTVTQMPHRGKGLPEMLEFVKLLRRGGLSILSQHGGFVCGIQSDGPSESHATWRNAIRGTLIFWEIPINERDNENIDSQAVL